MHNDENLMLSSSSTTFYIKRQFLAEGKDTMARFYSTLLLFIQDINMNQTMAAFAFQNRLGKVVDSQVSS